MRAFLVLGALALNLFARQAVGRPWCYYGQKPPDPDQELVFCPTQEEGACCSDLEEIRSISWFQDALPGGSDLTEECANYYRQVVCGPCNSYSDHLYEVLGSELGVPDGMAMSHEFCQELVQACEGQINFPSYDGESYCEKHTLGSTGASTDAFWSYPINTDNIVTDQGVDSLLFPSLPDSDLPSSLIAMHMTPDGDEWWLAGQDGQIVKLSAVVDPTSSTTVLDLSSGAELHVAYDEGLLDFAFSPAFNSNNYFYVSYTIQDTEGTKNRLSRFTYSSTPAATLGSIDTILTSEVMITPIHSAGWVGFKPSDYADPSGSSHDIYWATGDGGPGTDPNGVAQDTSNLLGAIIRVSVPSGTSASDVGYNIPSDNYLGGRGEICAPGFRNPFRCGFDSATDVLYCGDVGQSRVEELDIIECGNNYGWSRFEGSRCQEAVEGEYGNCDGASRSEFTFPVYEFCHSDYDSSDPGEAVFTDGIDICGTRSITGSSIIGGYVYHGQMFSDVLDGAYLFGDVQERNIHYLIQKDGEWVPGIIIGDGSARVISFAEDNNGEIYVIVENTIRRPYRLPCGEMCSTTCIDQSELHPTYESLGCYADISSDRALSLIQAPSCVSGETAMSPAICASYCETVGGAAYFGLEYRSECYCGTEGDDYAKHGALDDLSCNYLCVGSSDHFCGGDMAIEVFDLSPSMVPTPTVGPTSQPNGYLGCFGDDSSNRALTGLKTSSSSMTTDFCASFCQGSEYYGTQYGIECFCSATGDDYDVYGAATCDYSCSGDGTETCGGKNAMSVYAYGSSTTAEPSPAPTAVPEPTPTTPSPASVAYLGCFGDSSQDRALTGDDTKSSSMSTDFCASFCQGSEFFGTQFSTECFCSAAGDDYDVYGAATCDYPCSGDGTDTCGGKNAMSVYAYGSSTTAEPSPAPTAVPEPTPTTPSPAGVAYLGCFGDSNQDRALTGDDTKSSSMSTDFCASFCQGSEFFGTQFSTECFCSVAGDDYDVYGAATCDYPCSGDSTETCGGKNAISVYAHGGSSPSPTAEPIPTPAPTSVPEPTPTTPSPSGVVYLGCFGDNNQDRALTGDDTKSSSMTTDFCADFCQGSQYFGTEYSTECFCSAAGDDFDTHGTATCDFACSGDDEEICGGTNAISIYTYEDSPLPTPSPTPAADPTPTPTLMPGRNSVLIYLGCFGDNNQARVLTGSGTSSSSMTPDACAIFCVGSQYFGTEFGKECFCSAAGDDYDALGTATCDYPCSGDDEEICGGKNAISVYAGYT